MLVKNFHHILIIKILIFTFNQFDIMRQTFYFLETTINYMNNLIANDINNVIKADKSINSRYACKSLNQIQFFL